MARTGTIPRAWNLLYKKAMRIGSERRHGWLGLLRGLAVCVALLAVGVPAARTQETLTGRLLVATERMGDPRFDRTVIYMLEHGDTGAMGLIVNVPLGETSFAKLFEQLGLTPEPEAARRLTVYYGGPVEPGRGFLLHSDDVLIAGSHRVASGLAVTAEPELLRALARGKGPAHALFTLGYAGWAPGQLEQEIAQGSWLVVPVSARLVFDESHSRLWEQAVRSLGIDPATLVATQGVN
jgi:putative transcriptional regulator